MSMFVRDPSVEERIKSQRAELGIDQFDEVWDGVYVVSPSPNNQHQKFVLGLSAMFQAAIDDDGLGQSFPGVNVTDRIDDWTSNYRVPDMAVFLKGTTARDLDTHWLGGPDFAIEILSPGDRAREKFDSTRRSASANCS